jgi:hypothetical protein
MRLKMTRKTKTIRCVLLTSLASLSTLAVAQSNVETAPAQKSGAEESFDKLKTLAGSWVGQLTTFPPVPPMAGKLAQFSLRVTSRGNAFVHELSVSGIPDHPVTMFYLDEGRLLLTHYCDAGNRPRMAAKVSAAITKDTCIRRCSPSSTPTTTPRTGPTWHPGISRSGRISICSGRTLRPLPLTTEVTWTP